MMLDSVVRLPDGLVLNKILNHQEIYTPWSPKVRWDCSALESPIFIFFLKRCSVERRRSEILQLMIEELRLSLEDANSFLQEAVDSGFLIEEISAVADNSAVSQNNDALPPVPKTGSDSELSEIEDQIWPSSWLTAARLHIYVKNFPRMDYSLSDAQSIDNGLMQGRVSKDQIPAIYKTYSGRPVFILPQDNAPLSCDLKSLFSFKPKVPDDSVPLPLLSLSTILRGTFAARGFREMWATGKHLIKSSPSGGARHPTEVYIAVLNVEDCPQGLYHYDVENDNIVQLSDSDPTDFVLESVIVKKDWQQSLPKVVFIMTSIVERSMFRYRESRSYRVIHHDVGHLVTTARMLISAVGCESTCAYSMAEAQVALTLGINDLEELPISYISVR